MHLLLCYNQIQNFFTYITAIKFQKYYYVTHLLLHFLYNHPIEFELLTPEYHLFNLLILFDLELYYPLDLN